MTLPRHLVRAVALLLLASASVSEARAQEAKPGPPAGERPVHEDRDYCFRITAPDPSWHLFDEAAARKLVPDALAGMTDQSSSFWFVVAFPLAGGSLEDVEASAKTNLGGLLSDAVFGPLDAAPFRELPARRWETTGVISGVATRYRHLLFQRGDFCYQLFSWQYAKSPIAGLVLPDLDTLIGCFELTDGTPRVRRWSGPPVDASGVGWRVAGGVYQDAVRGIEIRPEAGWRVVMGSEREEYDEGAFVVLAADEPEAFLTLGDALVAGVAADVRERQMCADYAADYGAPVAGEPRKATIAGLDFLLREHAPTAEMPVRSHHGVRVAAGRSLQVTAWYPDAKAVVARTALAAAFRSIRALEPAARDALAAELRTDGDPQQVIGPAHSLRRGVYRDFARRLTWTAPVGWWEIDVGKAARATDSAALLAFSDVATGLSGSLCEWETGKDSLEEVHRNLIERLEPKGEVAPPTPLDLDGVAALVSEVRPGYLDTPWLWTVVTALHRGRGYELAICGPEPLYEAARATVAAATRSLAFPPRLVARETLGSSHFDHRLGFRFDPPDADGWAVREIVPDALKQMATAVRFDRGGDTIVAGAYCVAGPAHDVPFVRDLMLRSFRRRDHTVGAVAKESPATLGGLAAIRSEMAGSLLSTIWIAPRGFTYYFLIFSSTTGDPAALDRIVSGYHLLDE